MLTAVLATQWVCSQFVLLALVTLLVLCGIQLVTLTVTLMPHRKVVLLVRYSGIRMDRVA